MWRSIRNKYHKIIAIGLVISILLTGWPLEKLLTLIKPLNVVDDSVINVAKKIVEQVVPQRVKAVLPQFTPTSGWVVTGTPVALSATNVGSYRGALASDNVYWSVTSSNTGLNFGVNFGTVALNNANKIIVTTETANVTTARNFYIQVCDWSSSTGVDNPVDGQCTGGGWRTLNNPKATAFAETADTSRTFELFNGYFYTGTASGTPVNTPLNNFVTGGSGLKIRIYATTTQAVQFNVDRIQVETAIDPVYYAAGVTNIAPFTGAHTGFYSDTFANQNGTVRHSVANTAGNAMSFYYSFKDVRSYVGANTFLVNYIGAYVSATTLTYNVAIYNYAASTWENLNTTAITASGATTDQTNYFAKSTSTIVNYMSGGEVRIRIYSTATGVQTFQTNTISLTLGSVNLDTAQFETSFGQAVAGSVSTSTATLFATTTSSSLDDWRQSTCKNNTSPCATTPYPSDWAGTWGTNHSAASNLSFPITPPANAQVTGIGYAARFRTNTTTVTAQLGLQDFSGLTGATGGWIGVGTTNALTTYTYTEGMYQTNPDDFIDTVSNVGNMRLRTSGSTAVATSTRDWDFALMSIRWVETSGPTISNYVNSAEVGLNYAPACTDCGARIGPGASARQTIVISGTGFGSDPGLGNRDSASFKVEIVGPTSTTQIVDDGSADTNVASWSDTSITIRTDTTITGNADSDWADNFGGADSLVVTANGQESNELNFYILPNIISITAPTLVADAAREYDGGDTDGIITINGTRFGTSSAGGWVRILGCDAITCSSPTGSATTTNWSNTAVSVQVPTSISDSAYTGDIALQQSNSGWPNTDNYGANAFRILPRITNLKATSSPADWLTINGNHFCQSGSCPGFFSATNSVTYSNNVTSSLLMTWLNGSLMHGVPLLATTGPMYITSNGYDSNQKNIIMYSNTPFDPAGSNQYRNSGLTLTMGVGASISSSAVYFATIMQASSSEGLLYSQFEVKPLGTAFSCGTSTCAGVIETTAGRMSPGPIDCNSLATACATSTTFVDDSYHWQVRVKNVKNSYTFFGNWVSFGGNAESATDFQIDTTAPNITSIASSTTSNSATIDWQTLGDLSTSQVQYNKTGSFVNNCATNNDCTTLDSNLVTNHTVGITSLDVATKYFFRVRSIDQAGNESISATSTFYTKSSSTQVAVEGELYSSVIDLSSDDDGPAYNAISWQGILGGPSQDQGTVRFQVAASQCANGATNFPTCSVGSWSFIGGSTCSAGDWYDAHLPNVSYELGCATTLVDKRYFRYRIELCSDDCSVRGVYTPRVDSVQFSYSP